MNDPCSHPPHASSSHRVHRESKWTQLRQRIEFVLGLWIVIGVWLGAIAIGIWGVIYFFWYT